MHRYTYTYISSRARCGLSYYRRRYGLKEVQAATQVGCQSAAPLQPAWGCTARGSGARRCRLPPIGAGLYLPCPIGVPRLGSPRSTCLHGVRLLLLLSDSGRRRNGVEDPHARRPRRPREVLEDDGASWRARVASAGFCGRPCARECVCARAWLHLYLCACACVCVSLRVRRVRACARLYLCVLGCLCVRGVRACPSDLTLPHQSAVQRAPMQCIAQVLGLTGAPREYSGVLRVWLRSSG
jgi:hypothetical protein